MFGLHKKSNQASKLQQDVYYPFKTVLEKKQLIFGDKKHFSSNGFDSVQKQRNQRKRQNMFDDDEKRVRNGDRPFTKAKRSNCDVLDRNELQTYASLEKMLHKAIHVVQQLKKKGNTNTSSAPKQQNLRTNLFEEGGNDAPLSSAPGKTDMHGLIMESSNDICSLFDSCLPTNESSSHEITWRMFSTQLRSSSKKNQIKRSSDVGVMQFANQETFGSREFGPYGSSSPHLDPYRE
ncbi:hypothetical protein YC2023_051402 [Brassica napus]